MRELLWLSLPQRIVVMRRVAYTVAFFLSFFIFLDINWIFWSDVLIFPNDIIGTGYEAPLPNHHQVLVLDIDYGELENTDDSKWILGRVDSLQVFGDIVVGHDTTGLFSLNTLTDDLRFYQSREELIKDNGIDSLAFLSPIGYYWENRKGCDQIVLVVIIIIAFVCAFYLAKRITQRSNSSKEKYN